MSSNQSYSDGYREKQQRSEGGPGYRGGTVLRGRRGMPGSQNNRNDRPSTGPNTGSNRSGYPQRDSRPQADQPSTYGQQSRNAPGQQSSRPEYKQKPQTDRIEEMFGEDDAILLSQSKPVEQVERISGPRKRFQKLELLAYFKQTSELDFQIFEKDCLLENAEIFQTSADGLGKYPEALLSEPGDQKTPIQAAVQQYKKPGGQFQKKPYNKNQPRGPTNYEDDRDEPDPEWLDEKTEQATDEDAFFNRIIPDEKEIRQRMYQSVTPIAYEDIEDALDELIQNQVKEIKQTQTSYSDLKTGGYSDVDILFEKKQSSQQTPAQVKNQGQDVDIFEELMEKGDDIGTQEYQELNVDSEDSGNDEKDFLLQESEGISAQEATALPITETKQPTNSVELNMILKQQIQDLERQQQDSLKSNPLNVNERKFQTASQNLEQLFSGFPVNHRKTLKVKLEEIGKFEDEPAQETSQLSVECLFEKILGSLNPFSQFIIREMNSGSDSSNKIWELDEAIFKKHSGEVRRENLFKTSSEMFVIYKYTNDPHMMVKSQLYTEGMFQECKNLLPPEESVLFETSILNDIKAQELEFAKQQEELKLQAQFASSNPFSAQNQQESSSDEMSKILEAIVLANKQPP